MHIIFIPLAYLLGLVMAHLYLNWNKLAAYEKNLLQYKSLLEAEHFVDGLRKRSINDGSLFELALLVKQHAHQIDALEKRDK